MNSSTSSLAVGVNLPAHLVIIKSTQIYNGGSDGFLEQSQASIVQMLGRAGRPGFDTSATAVIMTSSHKQAHYENLLLSPDTSPLESFLEPSLADFLNSEVVLETVSDVSEAIDWTMQSFMHVRSQSSLRSKMPPLYPCSKTLCLQALESLVASARIEYGNDLFSVSGTDAGRIQSQQCLKYATLRAVMQFVEGNESVSTPLLLNLLASEARVPLRRGEKATLTSINKTHLRFRLEGPNGKASIQDDLMKTNLLLQASLGRVTPRDEVLDMEAESCLETAKRVARAALDYAIIRRLGSASVVCYLLWRSLRLRLWEDAPGSLGLQQIDVITEQDAKRLDICGVHTLRQLRRAPWHVIQKYLRCTQEHAEAIHRAASTLLAFQLRLVHHQTAVVGAGASGSVEVIVDQETGAVHDLTGRGCAYDLFVVRSGVLLLAETGIRTPGSFVVHLPQDDEAAPLSVHLLHSKFVGMDNTTEWHQFEPVVKKRATYQSTIPETFFRASGAQPVTHAPTARISHRMHRSPTSESKADAGDAAPILLNLKRFQYVAEPAESSKRAPTTQPSKGTQHAAPPLIPRHEVHVIPPDARRKRRRYAAFNALEDSESALEREFMNFIY
ncbi:DEAD/DEAH box helicase [Achlya hypogyna]|uniref:DEAD/DEAH box helicase n=1 Tax=Achlya hypogyna TaxID=1202772 RepID=A0A1V9YN48_ACHHY|nr:DEAD/DEAH box helicase [Achlya hypogyna]